MLRRIYKPIAALFFMAKMVKRKIETKDLFHEGNIIPGERNTIILHRKTFPGEGNS